MALLSYLRRIFLSACNILHSLPPPKSPISTPKPPTLLSLPSDVLSTIVHHATHSAHDSPASGSLRVVEQRTYLSSVALSETCTVLADVFFSSLDNVCLASPKVTDEVVRNLARRAGNNLRRIVLRGCKNITDDALEALGKCERLRSVDVSFCEKVSDRGVESFCKMRGKGLKKLLLRKCSVGDDALRAVGRWCTEVETLDVSYCRSVTDEGLEAMACGVAESLRLVAISYCDKIGDRGMAALGRCKLLLQVCARGLPAVGDRGFRLICKGLGDGVEGIDVTECAGLTRDCVLGCLRQYCGKVWRNVMKGYAGKSLRQVLVSTLRGNIFIVHGSDPSTGKETVHTVLIDNGDIVSASLLSSGTTDLSMLGIVLCKSFGSKLDEKTKWMLENNYGIPTCSLAD